jgi:hypothetical protein
MTQKPRRISINEQKAEAVRIVEQSGKLANQVTLARSPFADLANSRISRLICLPLLFLLHAKPPMNLVRRCGSRRLLNGTS